MEVSGQLNALAALRPGKDESPVKVRGKFVPVLQPSITQCRRIGGVEE